MSKSVEDRFWEKVRKSADSGCWEWTASKFREGYGKFKMDGRSVGAHRWAYEHLRGPIPPELVCDHLCRNPGCVNPAHIELVTQKENILRGVGITAQNACKTTCKNGHPLLAAGNRRKCPTCHTAWLEVHQEELTAYHQAWYSANREKRKRQHRAHYIANQEKICAQARAWNAANREKINARRRANRAKRKESE